MSEPQTPTGFDKFYDDYDRGTWCISAVDGQNFIVGDVLVDGLTTKQADDALRALAEAIAIGAKAERERLRRAFLEYEGWLAQQPLYGNGGGWGEAVLQKVASLLALHDERVKP